MIETSTTGILETGRDANWLEIISGPREIKLAANTPFIPIILDVLAYMRVFSKVDVLAARETGLTRLPLSIRFHSRMHAVRSTPAWQ